MTFLSDSKELFTIQNFQANPLAPFVIMYRHDGIGSRLANIFHGWRLAQTFGIPCIVGWPQYDEYYKKNAVLSDFFNFTNAPGLSVIEDIEEINRLLAVSGLFHISRQNPFEAIPRDAAAYRFDRTGAHAMQDESLDKIEQHAGTLCRSTPLNSKLTEALNAIHQHWNFNNHVAVHLRRGDIIKNFDLPKDDAEIQMLARSFWMRFVDAHSYANAIRELAHNNPLFVFSNDKNEIEKLRGLVDNDIVTIDDINHHLAGLTDIQRDFIEIVLMSKCHSIIAPGWSNYSGFAMTLGGIKRYSVQNWIEPIQAINTLEKIFTDRSYILSLMLEGYAIAMKKQKKHAEAELFNQKAEYYRTKT